MSFAEFIESLLCKIEITTAQTGFNLAPDAAAEADIQSKQRWSPAGITLPSVQVSPEERKRHTARLPQIRKSSGICLWDGYRAPEPDQSDGLDSTRESTRNTAGEDELETITELPLA